MFKQITKNRIKDNDDKKTETSEAAAKRLKRLDRLALIVSAFLVLILAGIIRFQFESLMFKSVLILFFIVLFCPEIIGLITTLLGALMYSKGAANGKTKKEVNITKSFAVVIALVIAIVVLGIVAVLGGTD